MPCGEVQAPLAGAEPLVARIPESLAGARLDRALATLFPDHSRTAIQKWIRQGWVLVDEDIPSQRDRVSGGEQVEILIPDAPVTEYVAEAIPLDVVASDGHLLILHKPAGLVVHPGAGHHSGTLLNALLHLDPGLAKLPRAGIVHRLDKDTSGLMVVARTETARLALIAQLAERRMGRVYQAVVDGVPIAGGTIDEPIGRDSRDRRRMAVSAGGREAVTHFRVIEKYRAHALVECRLATGRTHQIRVHLRSAGFPIFGDPVYGGRLRVPKHADTALRDVLSGFRRQALHAVELSLVHPASGEKQTWACGLADDMACVISALRDDLDRHG